MAAGFPRIGETRPPARKGRVIFFFFFPHRPRPPARKGRVIFFFFPHRSRPPAAWESREKVPEWSEASETFAAATFPLARSDTSGVGGLPSVQCGPSCDPCITHK
eukprot:1059945-Prorocentrum_minimum.AAC.1